MGFERELYEFSEPIASSSQVREMVCVSVRAGIVGTALVVTPMWIPNTATGKSEHRSLSLVPRRFLLISKELKETARPLI